MDVENSTPMSEEEKERRIKLAQEMTNYLLNTIKRGEELEERRLKEMLERMGNEKRSHMNSEGNIGSNSNSKLDSTRDTIASDYNLAKNNKSVN